MINSNGLVVFTATPEMAKQMPKVFKAGATYVAQKASAAAVGTASASRASVSQPKKKKASKKKVAKKVTKKASKKTKKKVAKKVKATRRKTVRPDLIIGFVRKNEGCNMTDIEAHTKLAQPVIRRVLNSARDSGVLRTEGERRGLRYFAGVTPTPEVAASN